MRNRRSRCEAKSFGNWSCSEADAGRFGRWVRTKVVTLSIISFCDSETAALDYRHQSANARSMQEEGGIEQPKTGMRNSPSMPRCFALSTLTSACFFAPRWRCPPPPP